MTRASITDILQACDGELLRPAERSITAGLTTDSRAVTPGSLFLALSGERFDGNLYAAEATRRGAAAVIISRLCGEPGSPERDFAPGAGIIRVRDSLAALQALASWWRGQLEPIRVIGLTGSSGKTSTKDMCAAILAERYRTTATRGNLNNHIGVPLSILGTEQGTEAAVWEMGMNHAGELAPLCAMTRPSIGIITTIGSAHIEYLGSREAIAHEKCTLARALPADGCMIYPARDDFADMIAADTAGTPLPVGGPDDAVRALNIRSSARGSHYTLCIDGLGSIDIELPVPGAHMVSNSLLAAAAGWKLGCSLEQIARGLSSTALTRGRLACREIDGYTVIDDSYNANPESMKAALETVADLRGPTRRIAVLGKMGELGQAGISAHAAVGKLAADLGYAALVIVGPECPETLALSQGAAGRIPSSIVPGPDEAAETLRRLMRPGDALLFKGSRAAGMERSLYALFPALKP